MLRWNKLQWRARSLSISCSVNRSRKETFLDGANFIFKLPPLLPPISRRNEDILEEAGVEPIATIVRRKGNGSGRGLREKKIYEKDNITAVLSNWTWRGSALYEELDYYGKTLSEGIWKPGTSGSNGNGVERWERFICTLIGLKLN